MIRIRLSPTPTLAKYGYHLVESDVRVRRAALKKAMREYGTGYLVRKINVLGIYRKGAKPGTRLWNQWRRAVRDKEWLQKQRAAMTPVELERDRQRYRDFRLRKNTL